jgi:hypothetical protein
MRNLPNLRTTTIDERVEYLENCLYRSMCNGHSRTLKSMDMASVHFAALGVAAAEQQTWPTRPARRVR